jgi:N6-L-threonylcarbamoyladenine synthase
MIILAIETSCDDTCVAVVEKDKKLNFRILSNVISSQVKLHAKYGGIYPSLAKREHLKNLPIVFEKALKQAKNPKIDAIAVTKGPGLEPCLWTGVNFAKEISKQMRLRIIPVNHIEAHILANWLSPVSSKSQIQNYKFQINLKSQISNSKQIFPAICLVVSGGHTQLILMKQIGKYKILGETRDDAAGECLDKTARILGLGYPGGPAISAEAEMEIQNSKSQIPNKYKIQNSLDAKRTPRRVAFKIHLPRPMMYSKDYDFSFSGLKTAVLYNFKNQNPRIRKSKNYIRAMAAEIQQAIIDVLLKKTIKAARDYKVKTIILGGGVTANNELRKQFQDECLKSGLKHLIPEKDFCTDNAVMIGITGCFHYKKYKNWKNIKVDANLKVDETF